METRLTHDQGKLLREIVTPGERIIDLGYGSGEMALHFASLGAEVHAYDRHWDWPGEPPPGVAWARSTFIILYERYNADPAFAELIEGSTAFIGWPTNGASWDLSSLVRQMPRVIYVGNTFAGMTCGRQDLWAELCCREVLHHMPDRKNSLIVYGGRAGKRELLAEEAAAIDEVKVRAYPYDS